MWPRGRGIATWPDRPRPRPPIRSTLLVTDDTPEGTRMPEITKAELDEAVEGQTIISRFLDTVARPPRAGGAARQAARRLVRGVDLRRVRRPGGRRRRPPALAGRRPGRPGGADDAEHPRVPLHRPRHRRPGRHVDLDLQLVVARAGRLPHRPLQGEAGHRRGRRVRGALPQGPRRAARARRRSSTCSTTACTEQMLDGDPVDLAAELGQRHPRHAGHRDLHVGHHRPAQGRDALPLQRGLDRRGLPPAARRGAGGLPAPSPTSRWPTSPSACPPTTWR